MNKHLRKELGVYFSVLVYIIVFTVVITTSTIVLHEFGHFYLGNAFGCSNIKIMLLDSSYNTYTQMNCSPDMPSYMLYSLMLGGFLFILPFCGLLLLLKSYEKYYALIVLGFNMIVSTSDLGLFPSAFTYASLLGGAALILYGESLLINKYIFNIEYARTVVVSYSNK